LSQVRHRHWTFAAGILLLCWVAGTRADEVVTLPTRTGVTQSYLLLPAKTSPAKVVAVMFPGGYGDIHLPTDGSLPPVTRNGNFLVRTRELFRDNDVGLAILDVPSDHRTGGLTDGVRMSAEHVTDVRAVVQDLRTRFPGAKIMLVGTSRGTLSVAYVARAMGTAIDGVVETSSLFVGGGRAGPGSLSDFGWEAIKAPLLFVHHEDDGCRVCPYSGAKYLATRYPLITVRGGSAPESDPCEAMSAHGYIGAEVPTVAAIKNWMLGRPYPSIVAAIVE
jgi:dienelactone hydrolase